MFGRVLVSKVLFGHEKYLSELIKILLMWVHLWNVFSSIVLGTPLNFIVSKLVQSLKAPFEIVSMHSGISLIVVKEVQPSKEFSPIERGFNRSLFLKLTLLIPVQLLKAWELILFKEDPKERSQSKFTQL